MIKVATIIITILFGWIFSEPSAFADEQKGKMLVISKGCLSCHSLQGDGGNVGPKLDGVGSRRDRTWLMEHVRNPSAHAKEDPSSHSGPARMPKIKLNETELSDIVDYLVSLK